MAFQEGLQPLVQGAHFGQLGLERFELGIRRGGWPRPRKQLIRLSITSRSLPNGTAARLVRSAPLVIASSTFRTHRGDFSSALRAALGERGDLAIVAGAVVSRQPRDMPLVASRSQAAVLRAAAAGARSWIAAHASAPGFGAAVWKLGPGEVGLPHGGDAAAYR